MTTKQIREAANGPWRRDCRFTCEDCGERIELTDQEYGAPVRHTHELYGQKCIDALRTAYGLIPGKACGRPPEYDLCSSCGDARNWDGCGKPL